MGRGLLELLSGNRKEGKCTLYECRDCGRNVAPTTEECPNCESTEIACFRL